MSKLRLTVWAVFLWTICASAQTVNNSRWREVFTDPELRALIDTALTNNVDIRTSIARVEQADATLRMARLSLLPTVSVGGEGNVSKAKGSVTTFEYSLPIRLQWEVSLSGRFSAEKKSAESLLWSAEETERAVRLQVVTAVASQYYTLLMLDEQLAITRESVENARRTVEVMEALKEAGMQNEAAVSQARAVWLSGASAEKTLLQQIGAGESALMLLLGQQRENIGRSTKAPDRLPLDYTTAYPLQSLSERPDVKASEYALAASLAQVDIARSAFYPTLNITASFNLYNALAEAVGSLVQPLFNTWRNKGNLRIAKATYQEALASFSQTLLVAGTELRDALSACNLSSERISLREQEVEAAEKACEASEALMQSGSATYLEVLTAQSVLFQSRLSLAADRLDLLQGQINLYKALGGNLLLSLQENR